MRHSKLLGLLVDFITNQWCESLAVMQVDHDYEDYTKPPKLENHIPDVYARANWEGCIVGEAKTPSDFESNRSQEQLACFLEYANKNRCIFCLATPFVNHRSVFSRLEYVIDLNDYKIQGYVVHELGFRRLRCKQ